MVAAVGFGRFAVFDALQWATSSRPSEAVAAGALLLVAAAGCVPMVSRHYPTAPGPRGCLIGAASVAALLVLLRPPFPVRTGAKCPHLPFGLCPRLWDEAHAPFHEVDDLIVYGIGERRRPQAPSHLCIRLSRVRPGGPSVSAVSSEWVETFWLSVDASRRPALRANTQTHASFSSG